jgi:hypothetical protein
MTKHEVRSLRAMSIRTGIGKAAAAFLDYLSSHRIRAAA